MTYNSRLPFDMSLLHLQNKHVTKALWEENEHLRQPKRHAVSVTKHANLVNPQVKTLTDVARFGHLLTFTYTKIKYHVVTTLMERWRMETHTFHLPHDEATMT